MVEVDDYYRAIVRRVVGYNRVAIGASGVAVVAPTIIVEDAPPFVPHVQAETAMRALVVLMGGKSVYFVPRTKNPQIGRLYLRVRTHVYFDRSFYRTFVDDPFPSIDVGCFARVLKKHDYDFGYLKSVLNGVKAVLI